jgi:hypothetical protein
VRQARGQRTRKAGGSVRRREHELWTTFIRDGRVDRVVGLRYLQALEKRVDDDVVGAARPSPTHHFFCHTGYTQRDCDAQVRRLRGILAGMDLAGLGEWTWVLVQSQEWKPILRRVGKDPENPAFTILEKRQTFLEDAPLDQVLRYAVTHELAHAMCREVDEAKATTLASQLLVTGTVACGV